MIFSNRKVFLVVTYLDSYDVKYPIGAHQLIATIPKHSEKKCAAGAKCHAEVFNCFEAYRKKQTKAPGSRRKMQTDREDGLQFASLLGELLQTDTQADA